jgi:ketosteroid isomerase-like protein
MSDVPSSTGDHVSNTRTSRRAIIALGAVIACSVVAVATSRPSGAQPLIAANQAPAVKTRASDSADVAHTVERFHQALARSDSAGVLALLAPTATILESGDVESVGEYRANHLPADIEFARTVKGVRTPTRVMVHGDAAWAIATSITQGSFRGRAINSAGAELMVLTRSPGGWRIAAIHWSSHRRGT